MSGSQVPTPERNLGAEQLTDLQAILSAAHSDLFDVLAHVAYALPPIPCEARAQQARLYIHSRCTSKQQLCLDFVLQHYVSGGVRELAQEKLSPLLRLRCQNSITDAVADLGRPETKQPALCRRSEVSVGDSWLMLAAFLPSCWHQPKAA